MTATWPALISGLLDQDASRASRLNQSVDIIARCSNDPAVKALLAVRSRLSSAGWTVRILLANDGRGLGHLPADTVRILSNDVRRLYDDACGYALLGDLGIAHGVDMQSPSLFEGSEAARDMNRFAFEAAWCQARPVQDQARHVVARPIWRWPGQRQAYAA